MARATSRRMIPRVRPLEGRVVPAVFTVTNLADAGPGSLRQAVDDSNAAAGDDTVTFQPGLTGTITLLTGKIPVTDALALEGPGSELITISGNRADMILLIKAASRPTVSVKGLTLADSRGNAIFGWWENVVLDGCIFADNDAVIGEGGAVFMAFEGSVTASDCLFLRNTAEAGGAISMPPDASLVLRRCTFTANHAFSVGGAIRSWGPSLLDSCSIFGNTADGYAGGLEIAMWPWNQPITIRNCTISGNEAVFGGGGIGVGGWGTLVLQNSTVTGNQSAQGGGVYVADGNTTVALESSVVAGNLGNAAPDVRTPVNVTASKSLLGNASGIDTVIDLGGNLPTGLAPMLSPLGDHGGPTQTHALLAGSPCIDAGANAAGQTTDQRGDGFARTVGAATDIGAFEFNPAAPPHVVAVQVNDGAAQRSVVRSFAVTFSEAVTFPAGIAAAFRLTRTGPGGPVGAVNLSLTQAGNLVTATVMDGGPVGLDPGSSLRDGRYTLTLVGTKTVGVGGPLDGDGDGTAGGDFRHEVHRLFGDADGDGDVDVFDLSAFRSVFGAGVSLIFDYDGNGSIDAADFDRFREQFGSAV